jgi:ABC-type nickel/cobalt efflux system permease component RcnA
MTARLLALALAAVPALVAAHPLGNFTVNRWAGLAVAPGTLTIRYVVDMAEIPAFQELRAVDGDGNGTVDAGERRAYLDRMAADLGRGLTLLLDGRPVPLAAGAKSLELPPGAGGLPTLRLEVVFAARLPAAGGGVEFRDRNFAGRPGWREVIASAGGGLALGGATVPATDVSRALTAYPADLLASPPQVSEARFAIAPGGMGALPAREGAAGRADALRFGDRMTELVATKAPLGLGLVLFSLLVAAVLGALHALGPGHGKTIVGAYLVGAHGTARHALLLGLVVTAAHTLGVYVLGLVVLGASHWVLPEKLLPWLGFLSGLIVVAIGASLVVSRLHLALGHDHDHHHDDHHHHGHAHRPRADTPPGWRSLVALGVSGGLIPCPSALVVMLGAIALGRVAFGLCLIVAFSAGLAAALVAIGLAFVYARRLLERVPLEGRVTRFLPAASALVVSAAGLAIVLQAIITIGA